MTALTDEMLEMFRTDEMQWPWRILDNGHAALSHQTTAPKLTAKQAAFHVSGDEHPWFSRRDIMWVQGRLNGRRETAASPVTGRFDEHLAARLAEFQRAHELIPATGAVDARTVGLLSEPSDSEPAE